jgi:hypothetical protein
MPVATNGKMLTRQRIISPKMMILDNGTANRLAIRNKLGN